jgi:hypothetical protein
LSWFLKSRRCSTQDALAAIGRTEQFLALDCVSFADRSTIIL